MRRSRIRRLSVLPARGGLHGAERTTALHPQGGEVCATTHHLPTDSDAAARGAPQRRLQSSRQDAANEYLLLTRPNRPSFIINENGYI